MKPFQDLPIKTLVHDEEKRICQFVVSDVNESYVGYQYKEHNVDFRVYFKSSNDSWGAYYLKYGKGVKIRATSQYVVIINNIGMKRPVKAMEVLYNDKLSRFIAYSSYGVKDFIFVIKNADNVN